MPVLTLDYRHCDRKRPKFIKHVEIEAIAALARQQLVGSGVDAIAFDTLRQIDRLKINGIDFALRSALIARCMTRMATTFSASASMTPTHQTPRWCACRPSAKNSVSCWL